MTGKCIQKKTKKTTIMMPKLIANYFLSNHMQHYYFRFT